MQVNGNVNAANFMQVGVKTNATASAGNEESGIGFADFLSDASQSGKRGMKVDTSKNYSKTENSVEKEEIESTGKTDYSQKKSDTPSKREVEKEVSEEHPVNNEPTKSAGTDASSKKDAEELMDECGIPDLSMETEEMEPVLGLLAQLFQVIMEQVCITRPQLEETLERFDMDLSDFMTEDGIKEFFLQWNEAEPADLLVNEELNEEYRSFLSLFDNIMEEMETQLGDIVHEGNEFLLQDMTVSQVFQSTVDEGNELLNTEMAKEPAVEFSDLKQETSMDSSFKKDAFKDDFQEMDTQRNISVNKDEASENTESSNQQEQKHGFGEALNEKTDDVLHKDTSVKQRETFENPILQAVEQAMEHVEISDVSNQQPVNAREVISQIVEQVRVQMNQDSTSMEMQLYPEHLGRIQIHVVSKDGVMTARIVAENEAAKQAIESGLASLKESMEQQNVKVEAIEVMVSTTAFSGGEEGKGQAENSSSSSKGRNTRGNMISEPTKEEEEAELQRMQVTGSSVSYMA